MPQDGLAHVLSQLERPKHPDLLIGSETFDDAGVFRLSDELALVQTTDFFPPLVDDPFEFGRIAAANALSDVYAMGGEPLTCLNIVCFPDKELDAQVLVDILRGGADAARRAGAVIVGGHSVRDAEVKYGMAVTGTVHPQRILANRGARAGDVLILTKPIGSGVLCSAAKQGRLADGELSEAINVMSALNKPGRDAAVAIGVNACTDITGFGLIGHASEMAEASDVTIVLSATAVPLMKKTLELAHAGILTRVQRTGRSYLGKRLQVDENVDEALAGVLLDAQTSGGLLLAVDASRAASLQQALAERGAIAWAVVGSVIPAGDCRVHLTT